MLPRIPIAAFTGIGINTVNASRIVQTSDIIQAFVNINTAVLPCESWDTCTRVCVVARLILTGGVVATWLRYHANVCNEQRLKEDGYDDPVNKPRGAARSPL